MQPREKLVMADTNKLLAAARKRSNASSRVLTAVVGIPLVAWIVWVGGAWLVTVTVLLALIAMRELIIACRSARVPLVIECAYPLLLLVFFALLSGGGLWSHSATVVRPFDLLGPGLALCAVPIFLLTWAVLRYSAQPIGLVSVALTTLAVFYTALFAFLPLIAQLPGRGPWMIWLLLLGVWSGDTIAYYAGRAFGRTRLTPLSPGKTREGMAAGFMATIAVCVLIGWRAGWPLSHAATLGVLIGIAAPLGDLAESFWKRELGVKDLGSLLPGHGGVLDRCDSLLFAAPVVYMYDVWRNLTA
jgi:phosphatidate cytidylyltransferase